MPSKSKFRRRVAAGGFVLSPEWRAWVIEQVLERRPLASILKALTRHGVPATLARSELEAVRSSPLLSACSVLARKARRLEMVSELLGGLAANTAVERRSDVAASEFYDRYFARNVPVVLTDATKTWRARALWTPTYFKERFGEVDVEITHARDGDPDCDMNLEAHRTTMRMAEFIDRLTDAGVTNDLYMVAGNKNMNRPELRSLFDDVSPDESYFDNTKLQGGVSLWIGPAGTVTPLHHDTTNILFCQIYGRKRVRLISPLASALLEQTRGVYSTANGESDLEGATVHEVELAPGEALFIPVGYWHHVRALEPSINFSLLNFRRENDFSWYTPGRVMT